MGSPMLTQGVLCLTCLACRSDSRAGSAQSTDCKCNQGYTGADGGICVPCEAGSFKMTSGSDNCTLCPPMSDSPAASTSASQCLCRVGHTRVDGVNGTFRTCGACPAGTYKDIPGFDACVKCRAGKYSVTVAATTDTCLPCPFGASSPSGSVSVINCTCDKGYTSSGDGSETCLACKPGKYKDVTGSAPCMHCFLNATSKAASDSLDDCVCNKGFAGVSSCSACTPGTYTDQEGSSACILCAAGKYSSTEAADDESWCLQCFSNSFSEKGSSSFKNCTCQRGFEFVVNASLLGSYACDACAPGALYKTFVHACACEARRVLSSLACHVRMRLVSPMSVVGT